MFEIVTENRDVYTFKRKGIKFWLCVLTCRLRHVDYAILNEWW